MVQALVEEPDLAGLEPVEVTDGEDGIGGGDHSALLVGDFPSLGQLLAFVNYLWVVTAAAESSCPPPLFSCLSGAFWARL